MAKLTAADQKILKALPDSKVIKEEYRRLIKLYEELPAGRLELVRKLIANAAFIGVKLDDLALNLHENGFSSTYKNGKRQSGTKATPEAQQYNSMIKNYSNILKQLDSMLPRKNDDNAGNHPEADDFESY